MGRYLDCSDKKNILAKDILDIDRRNIDFEKAIERQRRKKTVNKLNDDKFNKWEKRNMGQFNRWGRSKTHKLNKLYNNLTFNESEWCHVDTENEFEFKGIRFKINDSVKMYKVKNKGIDNDCDMDKILCLYNRDKDKFYFYDMDIKKVNSKLIKDLNKI